MKAAEITVSYCPKTSPRDRIVITSSKSVFDLIETFWNMDKIHLREEFVALYLDRKNGIIGHYLDSVGSDVATIVSVKQILAVALKVNACGLILIHNHPSGQLRPSKCDIDLTNKINRAAKMFDIQLHDHLIVTDSNYSSFADDGRL